MTVVADNPEYQIIRTDSPGGFTLQVVGKPGTDLANAAQVEANVLNALARARQIQAQAATFIGQVPYTTANLANLNDLLTKTQTVAQAVSDLAGDVIGLARLTLGDFDGTS